MARKKKETPAWVNKLLNFRKELTEDEYKKLWRRINKASRNGRDREAWNAEGQKIIRELEQSEKQPAPIFRSKDYRTVGEANRAAQIFREDHGGRVVRRDSRGRFNSKGRTFQVIAGRSGTRNRNKKTV